MPVYGNPQAPFIDINGNPLQGGKLYIGEPDQDAKANPNASVTDLNDNPISATITLNDLGVPTIPFKVEGDYSQAVEDINLVSVPSYQVARTRGFLTEADIAGGGSGIGDWNSTVTYAKDDVAKGSDGNYYKSLTGSNLNNDPTSVTTSWSRLAWPTIYNVNETYDIGDSCLAENGITYTSVVNSNTGNQPLEDDGTNWTRTRGCVVAKIGSNQSIPNATPTAISFNTEVFDTDNFHDNAVNNTRITIPANVARGRLIASLVFANNATGYRSIRVQKNGDIFSSLGLLNKNAVTGDFTYIKSQTNIMSFTAGDYFEVFAYQDSGGPLDVLLGLDNTAFEIEVAI